MVDIDHLLATARRQTRSITVCLRGDLVDEYVAAGARILELNQQHAGRESLAGIPEVTDLTERMDVLKADMEANSSAIRLEALPPSVFSALMVAHPPREDRPDDQRMGVNQSTFFEAVLPLSAVDPKLTPERAASLIDWMNQRQWSEMMNMIWTLNLGDVDIPFLRAASLFSTDSEPNSRQLNGSASPTVD